VLLDNSSIPSWNGFDVKYRFSADFY